jgi:ubiquitin carboxyl-terminal hydrolase 9/24
MSTVPEFNHTNALTERLQILRLVYGIQLNTQLKSDQLDILWSMCVLPADKELFMTFLANASAEDPGPQLRPENAMYNVDRLNPAFESNTRNDVFRKIFCSEYVGWESLGEAAYQSFQQFEDHGMRQSDAALDALWRICLTSGNNNVASQAMSDLLSVYSSSTLTSQESVSMNGTDHRFSNRIFKCLVEVKEGLQRGDSSSERSAERCISILNAAIEKCNSLGGSAGAVAERLASLQEGSSLDAYLSQVPHGLRGVSSCKRIQVLAKVISRNSPTPPNPNESDAVAPNTPQRFPLEIHPLQTVEAIKAQIGLRCNHSGNLIRITTGLGGRSRATNNPNIPDSTLASDLGLVEGSEIVAILSDKPTQQQPVDTIGPDILDQEQPLKASKSSHLDLSDLFSGDGSNGSSEFFSTLMVVLESLPVLDSSVKDGSFAGKKTADTHSLVWDLLLAMPTNAGIIEKVHQAASGTDPMDDAMVVESVGGGNSDWSSLVDFGHFERSVYVMQILDSLLRPATAMFSGLSPNTAAYLSKAMEEDAARFRINFTKSGGFAAVMRLFVESGNSDKVTRRRNRMGNACALRILKECFFTNDELSVEGQEMIETFADTSGFLKSLVCTVIDDNGITYNALFRVLSLVRMMLESGPIFIRSFASLPHNLAETFLTSLLLWEGVGSIGATGIQSTVKVRKSTEDMILAIPLLSSFALPWLVKALKNIDTTTDGSDEFFSVLLKLVSSVDSVENEAQLKDLGASVCFKLASYPRRSGDNVSTFNSTGVLCGCLKLLISLIEAGGNNFLIEGSPHMLNTIKVSPWSDEGAEMAEDKPLIDLMGAIFDGFVSSSKSSGAPPVCCDADSRRLAFNAVASAAKACGGGMGYTILATKINAIIANVAPSLRYKWGQKPTMDSSCNSRNTANYSGLKNQGCTCYMNSFLQQLFMMPDLRENLCSAELPASLRSTGGGALAKGDALIGKKISLHWDSGQNFEAIVEAYNADTNMHTISYLPIMPTQQVGQHHQVPQPDFNSLPRELPDEFILSEGRPGKETGAFEICPSSNVARTSVAGESSQEGQDAGPTEELKETEDEASSRKLLEEVQRTFVNLDEARGRCYDPRALVEASHCLKLEFDVWQQNDAAEFATKLLDRLEISLKKWSPSHFKYLTHKFGLKTTKQKICKECGLKVSFVMTWVFLKETLYQMKFS